MDIQREDGFSMISPKGKLDTITAPTFTKELTSLLEEQPNVCIVDLSGVSFLSSSGLQSLLSGAKTSQQKGIKYGVSGMNTMVKDVFMLSGFNNFIHYFENVEEAVAGL